MNGMEKNGNCGKRTTEIVEGTANGCCDVVADDRVAVIDNDGCK
jgi:hypothetical protein